MIRVHIRKSKRPNGTYQFKYSRVPQVEGDYSFDEIKREKIGISFTKSVTESEKIEILKSLGKSVVRIYGEPITLDYVLNVVDEFTAAPKTRESGTIDHEDHTMRAMKAVFKVMKEVQEKGYFDVKTGM